MAEITFQNDPVDPPDPDLYLRWVAFGVLNAGELDWDGARGWRPAA